MGDAGVASDEFAFVASSLGSKGNRSHPEDRKLQKNKDKPSNTRKNLSEDEGADSDFSADDQDDDEQAHGSDDNHDDEDDYRSNNRDSLPNYISKKQYDRYSVKSTQPTDPNYDMTQYRHVSYGAANTGPKGVLADARSFEEVRRKEMLAKQHSVYSGRNDSDFSNISNVNSRLVDEYGRPSLDINNEEDEDIMQMWRKNRLQELKSGAINRRKSPTRRKYGRLDKVDAIGYLDAVEKVPSDVVVVVLIYNDKSSESQFVEDCMGNLARRHTSMRFIKLHHLEAEMDSQVIPAVLAYKAGELIVNLPRIVDEIPSNRNLSTESLESVLKKSGVFGAAKPVASSGTSLYDWNED